MPRIIDSEVIFSSFVLLMTIRLIMPCAKSKSQSSHRHLTTNDSNKSKFLITINCSI